MISEPPSPGPATGRDGGSTTSLEELELPHRLRWRRDDHHPASGAVGVLSGSAAKLVLTDAAVRVQDPVPAMPHDAASIACMMRPVIHVCTGGVTAFPASFTLSFLVR